MSCAGPKPTAPRPGARSPRSLGVLSPRSTEPVPVCRTDVPPGGFRIADLSGADRRGLDRTKRSCWASAQLWQQQAARASPPALPPAKALSGRHTVMRGCR